MSDKGHENEIFQKIEQYLRPQGITDEIMQLIKHNIKDENQAWVGFQIWWSRIIEEIKPLRRCYNVVKTYNCLKDAFIKCFFFYIYEEWIAGFVNMCN